MTPKNWTEVTLNDIGKWGSGGTPKRTNPAYYGGDIPWLIIGDINDGYVSEAKTYITQEGLDNSSAKLVPSNTLLIAMYGSIGKLGITQMECATNQAIAYCHTNDNLVSKKFVFYYLLSMRQTLLGEGKGGAQQNISQTVLKAFSFPLPPLNEQKRIAKKLDELLATVESIKTRLDNAPTIIKRFRQSILAAATSGKLTEEWRGKQDFLPSVNELINQITQDQDKFYDQNIEEWKKKVADWEKEDSTEKKPTKPRRQKVPEEISNEELKNLEELPQGTMWMRLGSLVGSVKDGPHYSPKYSEEGIPFISGGNIKTTGIDFKKNVKYISKELHKELSKRCKPELNDVFYTKGGTTGIAKVNTYDFEFNVWVHVAVLKTLDCINPFYLQHVLNSEHCYHQSQKYTHGVGNQDLGLTRMILITMPVCSLEEQKEIVSQVESLFALADTLEEKIEAAKKRVDKLTQSILAKAFRGELVEQDSNDESAEDLLERIKYER